MADSWGAVSSGIHPDFGREEVIEEFPGDGALAAFIPGIERMRFGVVRISIIMSPLKAFQEALRQSPENIPLLLLYGRACLEELQMEDAVAAYEKAVGLDSRHTDAQLGLARALLLSGDASGAAVRAELVLQQEDIGSIGNNVIATVKLYALTTHTTVEADSFRLSAIEGRPTLIIVASSTANIRPRASANAAIPRRPGGKPSIGSPGLFTLVSLILLLF
jgi:hypothetical protein